MARPTKDLVQHKLEGTIQRAIGSSFIAGSLPRPPKDLSKEERKRFKGHVRMLADRRAVTSGDASLLAILVRTETRCIQAQEKITTEGMVVTYQYATPKGELYEVKKANIHLKILENAEKQCIAILVRLGLTPRDREHVRPTSSAAPKKNAPPHPESAEGLRLEVERSRAAVDAEQEQQTEAEVDLDVALEACNESDGTGPVCSGTPGIPS